MSQAAEALDLVHRVFPIGRIRGLRFWRGSTMDVEWRGGPIAMTEEAVHQEPVRRVQAQPSPSHPDTAP